MAFLLRRSSRTLSNLLNVSISSRFQHAIHAKGSHAYYLYSQSSRGISRLPQLDSHSSLVGAQAETVLAAVAEAEEEETAFDGQVDMGKDLPQNRRRADNNYAYMKLRPRFKTKSVFLKECNEMLSKGEVLNINQAFLLIKSCGRDMIGETNSTRNELVKYVWNELEKNGVALLTGMWNTLLSVYIENRYDIEPVDFLKDMWQKSNAEPNKATFSLLIQAYAIKGDPVGAMKIVEFMMQNDGKMTEHIYGWLAQAFAKSGDMDGVNEVLTSMRNNNVQPDHTTYSHLINAHAERGDLDGVDKTICDMIEHNFSPTSMIYISLLDHLSIGGHPELINSVWEKIDNIESITQDILPLLQQCVTRGDYESALILLKKSDFDVVQRYRSKGAYNRYVERRMFQMLKFSEKDIDEYLKVSSLMETDLNEAPLSRIPNLLDFLAFDKKIDTAVSLVEKVLPEDKPITIKMFHQVIRGYAARKRITEIVKLYEFMIERGIDLDYYCYKLASPALGEAGSEEHNLFLKLTKDNEKIVLPNSMVSREMVNVLKCDDFNLNQLSSAVANASRDVVFASLKDIKKSLLLNFNPVDAIEVVTLLHKRGLNNVSIIIEQIMGHLVEEKYDGLKALEFMKGMMENELPMNSSSYTKMLQLLHKHKMDDQFFKFVRLMKEYGVDPDVHQYYQMLKMASYVGNSVAAQFCFDKVVNSESFTEGQSEPYEFLITAYSRDAENVKNIPAHTQERIRPYSRDAENVKNNPAHTQERENKSAKKVVHLFEEMINSGRKPRQYIIPIVINNHLLAGDVDGANKLIQEYGEGKESMNRSVKNSFIKAYVDRKQFKEAEDLFNEMKEKSTVTKLQYNEMMRICEFTGDVNRVEELYSEMLANGFQANTYTYLNRIRTYLKAKQPGPCIDILEESLASKGKSNLRADIFMVILRHLVLTGDVDNVKRVIGLIKEHHLSKVRTKRLENALSLAYIKSGNLEEASSLLTPASDDSEMAAEIELNPYRNAAKYADGDVKYVENIIQFLKMNNMRFQTLDVVYLLALDKNDDINGIQRFYRERIEEGLTFDETFVEELESIIEKRGLEILKENVKPMLPSDS